MVEPGPRPRPAAACKLPLPMRILGRVIWPAIVDLPADITTTARLAVNGTVTGQHEHGRDVDWFAFAAEADTNYQFTANQGQKFATLNVLRIFQDDVSRASTKHTSGAEQKCTTREVIGQRKCPRQLFGRGVTEAGWQQAGRVSE